MTHKPQPPYKASTETDIFVAQVRAMMIAFEVERSENARELAELRREIIVLRSNIVANPPREWLTVAEAARVVNRTEKCIRWRCLHKNLANKVDGVYRIDRDQLRRAFKI